MSQPIPTRDFVLIPIREEEHAHGNVQVVQVRSTPQAPAIGENDQTQPESTPTLADSLSRSSSAALAALFGELQEEVAGSRGSPAKKRKKSHLASAPAQSPPATTSVYIPPTDRSAGPPFVTFELTQGNHKQENGDMWFRSNSRSAWARLHIEAATEEEAAEIERRARSDPLETDPDDGLALHVKLIYDDALKLPIECHRKGKYCDVIMLMTRQGSEKSADTIPLVCRNSFGVRTPHSAHSHYRCTSSTHRRA